MPIFLSSLQSGLLLSSLLICNLALAQAQLIKTLPASSANIGHYRYFVADMWFLADGETILTAAHDCTLKRWDINSGELRYTFNFNDDNANYPDQPFLLSDCIFESVTLLPKRSRFLLMNNNNTMTLWDIESASPLRDFTYQLDRLTTDMISPDEQYALIQTSSLANSVSAPRLSLWDLTTDSETLVFATAANRNLGYYDLHFSPDGRQVIASTYADTNALKLWDAETGQFIREFGEAEPGEPLAFSPDGTQVLSVTDGAIIKRWDIATGNELQTLVGHEEIFIPQIGGQSRYHRLHDLMFTHAGQQVLSAGKDGILRRWDINSDNGEILLHPFVERDAPLQLWPFISPTLSVTLRFDPTGHNVLFHQDALKIWELDSGQLKSCTNYHGYSRALALSPDGAYLANSKGELIEVWHVESGAKRHSFCGHFNQMHTLVFSADGQHLIAAGNSIKRWNLADGSEVFSYVLTHSQRVALSPQGTLLAVAEPDTGEGNASVTLWDTATGEAVQRITARSEHIETLQFSADGQVLMTHSGDGFNLLSFWSVATGIEISSIFVADRSAWSSVTLMPDGQSVVIAGNNGWLELWDVPSGALIRSWNADALRLVLATVSPDGKMIVSVGASPETRLMLWDSATGTQLQTLAHNDEYSDRFHFTPDGKTLLTQSTDRLQLWDIATGTQLDSVDGRFPVQLDAQHLYTSGRLNDRIHMWARLPATDTVYLPFIQSMTLNNTLQLTPLQGEIVRWEALSPEIASIDAEGVVTPSALGFAQFFAYDAQGTAYYTQVKVVAARGIEETTAQVELAVQMNQAVYREGDQLQVSIQAQSADNTQQYDFYSVLFLPDGQFRSVGGNAESAINELSTNNTGLDLSGSMNFPIFKFGEVTQLVQETKTAELANGYYQVCGLLVAAGTDPWDYAQWLNAHCQGFIVELN